MIRKHRFHADAAHLNRRSENATGEGFLSGNAKGLRLGTSNNLCRRSTGGCSGGTKHSPSGDGGHGGGWMTKIPE